MWAGVLGLVVIIATGFALKDWIREEWYLYRLTQGDEKAQRAAAERLGEMRSVRAVPLLADRLVVRSDEHVGDRVPVGVSPMGVEHATVVESWDYCQHIQKALVNIGAPGVPVLLERMKRDATARLEIMPVLGEMGAEARGAVPALREWVNDPDCGLMAKLALSRIESTDALPR